MEKNKLNVSLFFAIAMTVFLTAILLTPSVIATTLDSPAASSTVRGTIDFGVTVTGWDVTIDDLMNVTIYAKSSLTANSTWSVLGRNGSLNISAFTANFTNTSIDTTGVEDANDYIFNVTITTNTSSAMLTEDTNTGITVDNTVPQAPSSLYPTGVVSNRTFTVGATVVGRNTTGCVLFFDGKAFNGTSHTMAHSGNTCTFSMVDIPEESYKYFISAVDGTNNTNASTQIMTVDVKSSAGGSMTPEQLADATGTSGGTVTVGGLTQKVGGIPVWMLIAVVVVIIGIVIYNRRK